MRKGRSLLSSAENVPVVSAARIDQLQARENLLVWEAKLRLDGLSIKSDSACEQEARRAIRFVRQANPSSSSLTRTRLLSLIRFVEDEIGVGKISDAHLEKICDILQRAADSEIDFACPWHHLLPELNTKSRQLTLATTLWEFNRNLLTEWTIPLEDFVKKVWGDEEQKTSTVRSAVSQFLRFLKEREIGFEATVHDRRDKHNIECKLTSG